MLESFAPSLYIADGPDVSFYGFPYPTRMVVVQLSSGDAWVWSPIKLTDELKKLLLEYRSAANRADPKAE